MIPQTIPQLTTAEFREKVLKLLDQLKVPHDTECQGMWYDGRWVAAGVKVQPEDILHEAAHWLLAEPLSRKTVNFGLGPDPHGDTPDEIKSPTLYYEPATPSPHFKSRVDQEEESASALGILLVAMLGGNFKNVLEEHGWVSNDGFIPPFYKALKFLRGLGLVVPRAVESAVRETFATERAKLLESNRRWDAIHGREGSL